MKAWRLHDFGLAHLKSDEVSIPVPGTNEVLIPDCYGHVHWWSSLQYRYFRLLSPLHFHRPHQEYSPLLFQYGWSVTSFFVSLPKYMKCCQIKFSSCLWGICHGRVLLCLNNLASAGNVGRAKISISLQKKRIAFSCF